uniref:Protein-tyrosine-phosphatase n=2 Tax=Rhodosorus marinus TaxID=101924 RepID=A0A7S3AAN5_9RHOD|mmetsp:Transcript_9469/g.40955  ORF Transcript_9469/g.40955 Transcript_9469/m.40955 type:complete len:399 (+) Transcript_9469:122-1318(+)
MGVRTFQARCTGVCEGEGVAITGSFCGWNVWDSVQLEKDEDGFWCGELDTFNDDYEYKYIVTVNSEHDGRQLRGWEVLNGNRTKYFQPRDPEAVYFPCVVFRVKLMLLEDDRDEGGEMLITGACWQIGDWHAPARMTKVSDDGDLHSEWELVVHPITVGCFSYRYLYNHRLDRTTWWEQDPDRTRYGSDIYRDVLYDDHIFRSEFKTSFIWDRILMGPYPQKRSDVRELNNLGVKAVLSLQTDNELSIRGVNSEAINNYYLSDAIHSYRYQMKDFDAVELERYLLRAAGILRTLLNHHTDGNIYVHCMSGISRSAAVLALEKCNRDRVGYDQVFDEMRWRRPVVSPNHAVVRNLSGADLEVVDMETLIPENGRDEEHVFTNSFLAMARKRLRFAVFRR